MNLTVLCTGTKHAAHHAVRVAYINDGEIQRRNKPPTCMPGDGQYSDRWNIKCLKCRYTVTTTTDTLRQAAALIVGNHGLLMSGDEGGPRVALSTLDGIVLRTKKLQNNP